MPPCPTRASTRYSPTMAPTSGSVIEGAHPKDRSALGQVAILRAAMWGTALIVAVAAAAPNPYLEPTLKLYQSLEFEEALRTVDRALGWQNTPEEEVSAALLEGIVTAQL